MLLSNTAYRMIERQLVVKKNNICHAQLMTLITMLEYVAA